MQTRSDLWKELAASGSARLETVAEINGMTYTSITAPVINRALMMDALSVGNCVSATLHVSILTGDIIPQSAEIVIRKRFSDGTRFSEWLPAGTFYISQRQDDKVTKRLVTLTCYDAMRKADRDFPLYEGDENTWPKSMKAVISEIAVNLGVDVDERTWLHIRYEPDYMIPRPEGLKMKKILGYIAALHGGNWCITQDNRLRFVPLLSGANAEKAFEKLEIFAILGNIQSSMSVTVTGVSISNGQETFFAGDDSGFVLTVPRNPYATQTIADDLLTQCGGLVYTPYRIAKGFYDPAVELGDYVVSRNDLRSVLYYETAYLNLAYRGDISAPFKSEIGDEYPYKSKSDELDDELQELVTVVADKASIDDLIAVQATINNLSVSDIKTGIIHSNDYQYAPYPLLYPSNATYPSETDYPSNGEFILRGFAIDFATGTIYGAFYSEQIYALQEITSEQADQLLAHIRDYTNPHKVTAAQVGLGNVDNTSDANKPVSVAQRAALDSKVDKVPGKGLSTNDYTTAEKNKLSDIDAGAQVNSITGIKGNAENAYRTGNVNLTPANIGALPSGTYIPVKTSDLDNDSTFQTEADVDKKIDAKISGVYRASGQATLETLPALTETNLGRVYDMIQDFTTTTDFVEGAGKTFPVGTNVAVVSIGNAYKYDVLAGVVDLSALYSRIAMLEAEVTKLKNSLTYPKS